MFADNHDSDQSISEEEDLGFQSPENYSFSSGSKEKSMQVLSQLEILRKDAYEFGAITSATISIKKGHRSHCVEDEIEFPVFNNEDNSIDPRVASMLDSDEDIDRCHDEVVTIRNSDEDIISDEEIQSPEKALSTAAADANEIGPSLNDRSQTELHFGETKDAERSNMKSLHVLDGRNTEKQEEKLLAFQGAYHDCTKRSVTELLEHLQEKSSLPQGNSEIYYGLKGRRTKAVLRRRLSALGDRNIAVLQDVGSSSGDEDLLKLQSVQQKTVADQLCEAFESVPQKDLIPDIMFHRESRNGLFEKLQNVMVIEKERDIDFLKKFQMNGSSTDGRGFLDVKILTKSLEAKLNVCCCTLIGDHKNSQWLNYFRMRNQTGERILSIIFSSRMCGDVELEIGKLIRIHSPWEEVDIKGKDEIIILSTYFSQL